MKWNAWELLDLLNTSVLKVIEKVTCENMADTEKRGTDKMVKMMKFAWLKLAKDPEMKHFILQGIMRK